MCSLASFKIKTGLCDEPNGPSLIPEIFFGTNKGISPPFFPLKVRTLVASERHQVF